MNEKTLNDLFELKKTIIESSEYKKVLSLNALLENSDEVKILSYKKDMAILDYEDVSKHFPKNSLEVLEKEKALAKAIYNLNNHDLVKKYNKAFEELSLIYERINSSLFSFYEVKK
jgi:cell fate (sporulation/competence/biofilm development) regulator YlbF (YheA/YmcA/DUF963 family)